LLLLRIAPSSVQGLNRQAKPRKRKALPRVAKRPANLKPAGRAGFRSDRRACQTLWPVVPNYG